MMKEEIDQPILDEIIRIQISENKLEATLHFEKWVENLSIRPDELNKLLGEYGITYGILQEQLEDIANNPSDYRSKMTLIAKGDEPVDGSNGKIRLLYELDNKKNMGPALMENGKVDYKEIHQLNNVKKGQPIALQIPPTKGINGKTVTGEEIVAKDGKEKHFKAGKNVVIDKEKKIMYAAIDGLVTKTDRDKLNVFPVYEVNGDVDYHVGNIDFVGTVVIRGSVLPGFKIKAAGDIRVIGGVEAGELQAEGSIEITGGVLGQNKGMLHAGKSIVTTFIQDGNIFAKEDVIVSQSIMHSHVKAGRHVICKGSKGLIVGGVIQAGDKVVARTMGNTTSTQTVIEVGVHPELRDELIQLRQEFKASKDNMDKTEKALNLLNQMAASGQLPPDKMAMRIKLNNTKKKLDVEMGQLKERMMEIEKRLEDITNAEVEVTGTIHTGVKVVLGRYTRFVKDAAKMVKFVVDSGEAKMIASYGTDKETWG